jgi:hypothetical protein
MRAIIGTLAALVVVTPAHAGTFGGFSADESSFLRASDQICTPLPAPSGKGGEIRCRTAAVDEIAAHKFRRGTVQNGQSATYRADIKGGDALRVFAVESGKCRAAWSSLDPISRISGIYLSTGGRLLAIEFETRAGGRLREAVIAFVLPAPVDARRDPPAPDSKEPPAPDSKDPPPPLQPVAAVDSKAVEAGLAKARKLAKKRNHKRTLSAFLDVIALDPSQSEAMYGVAVVMMKMKNPGGAISTLGKLAASIHPEAVVWMVEARTDKVFAKLRADKGFRRAVGLDHDGSRTRTAYERLVGYGGHWEQPGVSCDAPKINLKLQRRVGRFTLRLVSKCQGMSETTRLDGRWVAGGTDKLSLTFPNVEGSDEVMVCQLSTCTDGSGEDCLDCAPGTDMEMQLRLVRR